MIKNLISYFAFVLVVYFLLKFTFDYFDDSNKFDTYNLEGYIYKKNFSIKSLRRPIIFIHLPDNTRLVPLENRDITKVPEINDALLYLNIKSVIRHCGKSNDIVIFDNTNVVDLLDDERRCYIYYMPQIYLVKIRKLGEYVNVKYYTNMVV